MRGTQLKGRTRQRETWGGVEGVERHHIISTRVWLNTERRGKNVIRWMMGKV